MREKLVSIQYVCIEGCVSFSIVFLNLSSFYKCVGCIFRCAGSPHNLHIAQCLIDRKKLSQKQYSEEWHKISMHYCQYHSWSNTFLFLASCRRAISQGVKHLTADGQWKVNRRGFPWCWKLTFFPPPPFSLFVVNKCKWTKLSPCHPPPPPSLPAPVFFLSVCLWNTPVLSHTKEGKCHYGNKEARFLKATSRGES